LVPLALAGLSPPAAAQLSFRMGAVHARYADAVGGSALQVAPRLLLDRGALSLSGEGVITHFVAEGAAAQGRADVGVGLPLGLHPRHGALLLASGEFGDVENGPWSALTQLSLMNGLTAGPVLLAVNLDGGWARGIQRRDATVVGFGAAASTDLPAMLLDVRLQRTVSDLLSYTDVAARAERVMPGVSTEALLGTRFFGPWETLWYRGRVALEVGPSVSVEAMAGRFPRDITGFTEGVYASLGVRVAVPSRRMRPPARARRPFAPGLIGLTESRAEALAVEPLDEQRVRVTIEAPGARRVAIAGQWNAWRAQPMRRAADGRWTAVLPLAPGAHKFALVLDGGRWTVPRGVPTVPDDFGQSVGLILVVARR
jgi:hypothetical protein